MGAWGVGNFANDDAMDWVWELEAEGLSAIVGALDSVLDLGDDYLEVDLASCVLAAAEVVAALAGQPAADLPDEVTGWIAANPGAPSSDLIASARRAIDRVAADSELQGLWADTDHYAVWEAQLADLHARLA